MNSCGNNGSEVEFGARAESIAAKHQLNFIDSVSKLSSPSFSNPNQFS